MRPTRPGRARRPTVRPARPRHPRPLAALAAPDRAAAQPAPPGPHPGLFLWTGRSARRQLAGLGGIGRSRAKVFDAERPETTLPFISVTGSSFVELFVGTTGHSATAMPAGEPATATRT